jgi:hypothetical protein
LIIRVVSSSVVSKNNLGNSLAAVNAATAGRSEMGTGVAK